METLDQTMLRRREARMGGGLGTKGTPVPNSLWLLPQCMHPFIFLANFNQILKVATFLLTE